ncbi:MAG: RNase H family protein [Candidatus Bathyarchaeia archaeon]
MSKVYDIYTDGAFDYKTSIGAYAFCVFDIIEGKKKLIHAESGVVKNATCNRAEYEAFIKACEFSIENLVFDKLLIKSDSSLLVNTYNKWAEAWVAKNKLHKMKNTDLVLHLLQLKQQFKESLCLTWVKGHAGILGNEIADKLAQRVIDTEKKRRMNRDASFWFQSRFVNATS